MSTTVDETNDQAFDKFKTLHLEPVRTASNNLGYLETERPRIQSPRTLGNSFSIKSACIVSYVIYILAILAFVHHSAINGHILSMPSIFLMVGTLFIILIGFFGLFKERKELLVPFFIIQIIFMGMLLYAWGTIIYYMVSYSHFGIPIAQAILVNTNALILCLVHFYFCYLSYSCMCYLHEKQIQFSEYYKKLAAFAIHEINDDLVIFDRSDSLLGTPSVKPKKNFH